MRHSVEHEFLCLLPFVVRYNRCHILARLDLRLHTPVDDTNRRDDKFTPLDHAIVVCIYGFKKLSSCVLIKSQLIAQLNYATYKLTMVEHTIAIRIMRDKYLLQYKLELLQGHSGCSTNFTNR